MFGGDYTIWDVWCQVDFTTKAPRHKEFLHNRKKQPQITQINADYLTTKARRRKGIDARYLILDARNRGAKAIAGLSVAQKRCKVIPGRDCIGMVRAQAGFKYLYRPP